MKAEDLCRGKHIASTGQIGKAFKLLSVAGAYWKGDASREQLQRLYATAYFDKKELEAKNVEVERANRLIGDLLDFTQARLGGGLRVARRPLDLHAVVAECLDEVQIVWPGRRDSLLPCALES